ncbi:MAG TPA: four-carbon acid sugar kinase family protein [Acetobacteraceae bacterium]|nr:four-carbon acid sugar kinase family protein [Acetobacteraceae bacterium]
MSGPASGPALPDGLLLSFYGDDYTGSSAVMEVMSFAGLPTVLFLQPPTADDLSRFAGYRGIGIAGTARSRSPGWMDEHLPPIFRTLARLGAPIAHYKVCSTFDSSPETGSIGRAIDLAAPLLGGAWHPLLVAAPELGRCQVFGNLFAVAEGRFHRLDRHPTMSRHPVTPMREADARLHLARQTARRIGLIDFLALRSGGDRRLAEAIGAGEEIIAIDALDEETLAEAGGLIWRNRGRRLLAIGSQGVEYALVAHWRASGLLPASAPAPHAAPMGRIAAVSASCAPVTAQQIRQAERENFSTLRIDPALAVDEAAWERELDRAARLGLAALAAGRGALAFTALGPDDPAIAATRAAIASSGARTESVNERIGAGLGRLLDRLMREGGVSRGVIAGGDTSGHAAQALGIRALTALAPIAPGAPLCNAHGEHKGAQRRELIFKGGQMGAPDFFRAAMRGTAAARAA